MILEEVAAQAEFRTAALALATAVFASVKTCATLTRRNPHTFQRTRTGCARLRIGGETKSSERQSAARARCVGIKLPFPHMAQKLCEFEKWRSNSVS